MNNDIEMKHEYQEVFYFPLLVLKSPLRGIETWETHI